MNNKHILTQDMVNRLMSNSVSRREDREEAYQRTTQNRMLKDLIDELSRGCGE
jgi:hypothetical protein